MSTTVVNATIYGVRIEHGIVGAWLSQSNAQAAADRLPSSLRAEIVPLPVNDAAA